MAGAAAAPCEPRAVTGAPRHKARACAGVRAAASHRDPAVWLPRRARVPRCVAVDQSSQANRRPAACLPSTTDQSQRGEGEETQLALFACWCAPHRRAGTCGGARSATHRASTGACASPVAAAAATAAATAVDGAHGQRAAIRDGGRPRYLRGGADMHARGAGEQVCHRGNVGRVAQSPRGGRGE